MKLEQHRMVRRLDDDDDVVDATMWIAVIDVLLYRLNCCVLMPIHHRVDQGSSYHFLRPCCLP